MPQRKQKAMRRFTPAWAGYHQSCKIYSQIRFPLPHSCYLSPRLRSYKAFPTPSAIPCCIAPRGLRGRIEHLVQKDSIFECIPTSHATQLQAVRLIRRPILFSTPSPFFPQKFDFLQIIKQPAIFSKTNPESQNRPQAPCFSGFRQGSAIPQTP